MTQNNSTTSDRRREVGDPKLRRLVWVLIIVAVIGLTYEVAYGISAREQKSDLIRRIEALEAGRRDQQEKNKGIDAILKIIMRKLGVEIG